MLVVVCLSSKRMQFQNFTRYSYRLCEGKRFRTVYTAKETTKVFVHKVLERCGAEQFVYKRGGVVVQAGVDVAASV